MKAIKILLPLVLSMIIVLNLTSCFLVLRKDNGNHKGWYKNPGNNSVKKTLIFKNGNGNGNGHNKGKH